jgi:[ribosomal protein S5]-alanine N-acetyltransferase
MFQRTELRTERLLLRPWRLRDIDDAYAYASDEEWARYLWNTPWPYERRHAEEFVGRAVADTWETQAQFAIEFEHRVIGGIRLYLTNPPINSVAGLGYNVGRPYWNRGFVTEAAMAMLNYGFGAGLHKVSATADSRNVGSIRVMEKLGMIREGVLRRHRFSHGEYVDEVHYGLLTSEWQIDREIVTH